MDEIEFNDSPSQADNVVLIQENMQEDIDSDEGCPSDGHFDDLKATLMNHIKVI
jgi:hypothetical protein